MDYRKGEKLSWCSSWSNSPWQGWSCGLVHCPAGNATEPIWRVLASSDGISSWTPLKPQHSNPNPNLGASQLWCIDFLTPLTLSSSFTDSLPSMNLLCFSRVRSNSCCSCYFEPEIIKIGQSSHKMNSNNTLNFQESTTILNSCTKKKVWKLIEGTTYIRCAIYPELMETLGLQVLNIRSELPSRIYGTTYIGA